MKEYLLQKDIIFIQVDQDLLPNLMENWINLCNEHNDQYFISACDLTMSYYLQQPDINVKIVYVPHLSFLYCNHNGYPCHRNEVNIANIIACHNMSTSDFDEFTEILNNNNYYV